MDPTGKKNLVKKRQNEDHESLIPVTVIDHASQRLFMVSIFILIQCWKIYDIILIRTDSLSTGTINLTNLNNFTFVLKYAITDGLFLWLLPVLNIPYLSFSPLITLLFTLAMNSLTFFLASNITIPLFTNLILPFWKILFSKKELTIIGDSVKSSNVINMNSHFKGEYTIHYLPDSSAKLNPFHFDNLCLNPASSSSIHMPIEFNTTTQLGFLQIEHITSTEERKYINYTKNDLTKILRKDLSHLKRYSEYVKTDQRVFYLEVEIKSPGKYRISQVKDAEGTSIRTYKSDFLISHCPSAEFVYPVAAKQNYKCVGTPEDESNLSLPLVKVLGVTPMIAQFSVKSEDDIYTFNRTINSEVEKLSGAPHIKTESLTRNLLEQEILRNPSILASKKSAKLEFQITEITDYFGNSKKYNPVSKDKDVWYQIELKESPNVILVDTNPDEPLINNATKKLYLQSSITEENDFPLSVVIGYESRDNQLLSYNFTELFHNKHDLQTGFEIKNPGIYRIIKAHDAFCSCSSNPTEVHINTVSPPLVEIEAEPILDRCVGMIGYKFDFNFVGTPPFNVQYQVFKKLDNGVLRPALNEQGRSITLLKTATKKYNFEYRPPTEGNYVLVFKNLNDLYYHKSPIALDENVHTYLTYFKQRSKVSFFENSYPISKSLNLCLNQSTQVPLFFQGHAPFSFTYDFINTKSKSKSTLEKTVENWNDTVYKISTPHFSLGGEFKIALKNIQDHLGCEVDFSERESILIQARPDIPEAGFTKSAELEIVEGDIVKIPIIIKSSVGPGSSDELKYTVANLHDSKDIKTRKLTDIRNFKVKEEGIYSLKSFLNAGCSGKISNSKNTVRISYYPKPNLTVTADPDTILRQHLEENDISLHLKPLCQNSKNKISLNLEGAKPFVVDYEVKNHYGKVESRTIEVDTYQLHLDLPSTVHGRYEHHFKGIYDSRYTKQKFSRLSNYRKTLPVVRYDIKPLPNASFVKGSSFSQVCENNLKQLEKSIPSIPVALSGVYPFTIKASIRYGLEDEHHYFTLKDISEPYLHLNEALDNKNKLLPLQKKMKVGEHLVTLHEVIDGNGCEKKNLSHQNNYVIGITDAPNITKLIPRDYYCVGDHIAYNMTGVSPFTVYYKFNDKNQKAELSYSFFRLASKPGDLSITALQDSSENQCLVNFTHNADKYESLKLKVHDLPSVEVSQGENIIRNIHEGDQTEITFTFTGVPPFYLKYIREFDQVDTRDPFKRDTKKAEHLQKVIETKVVEEIWDHEYTVVASLEGTYRAIEVRDAFCKAVRDDIDTVRRNFNY